MSRRCGDRGPAPRTATKRRVEGFTLIEIMVVVVIIGILATLVIMNIAGKDDQAKAATTRAMISEVGAAIDMFKLDHNRYPEKVEDLVHQPSYVDPGKWKSPYLKRKPLDSWGREFVLRVPGSNYAYDLISFGADGKEGGKDFDEDLWNHELANK